MDNFFFLLSRPIFCVNFDSDVPSLTNFIVCVLNSFRNFIPIQISFLEKFNQVLVLFFTPVLFLRVDIAQL